MTDRTPARHIGLPGATLVGVGAIVGGGILVLAGVAYERTGPSALIAFALNGIVALITAASFAEMASAFPESGGAYTFAKKVLSVRAAFATGWVLWFAYIVAGGLYALGFASFAAVMLGDVWVALGSEAPGWLLGRGMVLFLAAGATGLFAHALIRKSTGGGQSATVGKMLVFCLILLAGVWALMRRPFHETQAALVPFMPGGLTGMLAAMGFTFIALQGFDLIAAIAGEVRTPGRTIPRAMFLSLGTALLIYIPLLFMVATVGVGPGESIGKLAAESPDTVMAVAVERFMGRWGYWLVMFAAILSTLSALHANILAASRVALSMATDRTLPSVLGVTHARHRTPLMAISATVLTLMAILFMVPDIAGAGAAASLIFLISFALAQITAILARRRGGLRDAAFRTPFFPLLPVVGTLACAGLAVFQAVVSPVSAGIVVIWLGLGGILYFSLFAARAETVDASAEAFDPALARLRGRNPLVLLPIANPSHSAPMVAVANALAPPGIGRVVVLTIVPEPRRVPEEELARKLEFAQQVIKQALTTSFAEGRAPETLITAAPVPWAEIARVAKLHGCETLLLGLGMLSQTPREQHVAKLLDELDVDVALMRAPPDWRLENAGRVLVPVGGRGIQHGLRARLLGSICRTSGRDVTFLRILDPGARNAEAAAAEREIGRIARDKVPGTPRVLVKRGDDPATAILEESTGYDLIILGLARDARRLIILDGVARRVAFEAPCATILLSRRR